MNWYQGRVTERIRANVEAEKQAQSQANWDSWRRQLFPLFSGAYDRYQTLTQGGVNPLMALFDAAVLSPFVQYAPLALSFYQGFGGVNPFTGEQLSQGERDFNQFMFLMEVVHPPGRSC